MESVQYLILCETFDTLVKSECWTQRTSARDNKENPVHPTNDEAVKWCIEGAITTFCAFYEQPVQPLLRLLDQAAIDLYPEQLRIKHMHFITHEPEESIGTYFAYETIGYVNDQLGHQAILDLLQYVLSIAIGQVLTTIEQDRG